MNWFKKNFRVIALLTILLVAILAPEFAMAATGEQSNWQEIVGKLTAVISLTITLIYPLIWVVVVFIGLFMDNEFLLGGGIEEVLINTWRMVRNIVNIGFVIVLLVIALYNVTGLSSYEELEWKKALKRFVLAVVMVNFSFFGVKVVLDVANVFTAGVFAMPRDIIGDFADQNCYEEVLGKDAGKDTITINGKEIDSTELVVSYKKGECTIPGHIMVDFQAMVDGTQGGKIDWDQVITFDQPKQLDLKTDFGSHNVALILAENVLRLRDLPMVGLDAFDDSRTIDSTIQVFMKGAYGLIFMLLYGIGFFLVAITLLGRAVYIWAFMCLSPIIALLSALEGVGGITSKVADFSVEKFITYAIIPVKVALVTSLGFLLISQFNKVITEPNIESTTTTEQAATDTPAPADAIATGSNIQLTGGYNNNINVTFKSAGVFSNFNDIRQLAFHLIIVVVLWKGIEWATKDTVTSSLTDSVWNGIKGWGTKIAQAPLQAVTIPYFTPGANGKQDEKSVSAATFFNFLSKPDVYAPALAAGLGFDPDKDKAAGTSDVVSSLANANNATELTKAIEDKQVDTQFLTAPGMEDARKQMMDQMLRRYGVHQKLDATQRKQFTDYKGQGGDELAKLMALAIEKGNPDDVKDFQKRILGSTDINTKDEINTWLTAQSAKSGSSASTNPQSTKEAAARSAAKVALAGAVAGIGRDYGASGSKMAKVLAPTQDKVMKDMDESQAQSFQKQVEGDGTDANPGLKASYDNLQKALGSGVELSDQSLARLGQLSAAKPELLVPMFQALQAMAEGKATGSEPAYEQAVEVVAADPANDYGISQAKPKADIDRARAAKAKAAAAAPPPTPAAPPVAKTDTELSSDADTHMSEIDTKLAATTDPTELTKLNDDKTKLSQAKAVLASSAPETDKEAARKVIQGYGDGHSSVDTVNDRDQENGSPLGTDSELVPDNGSMQAAAQVNPVADPSQMTSDFQVEPGDLGEVKPV